LRVIRKILGAPKPIQRQHARGDAVEQIAVVRHQHQRAGELEQRLFEHVERGDVEVVRRLVHH